MISKEIKSGLMYLVLIIFTDFLVHYLSIDLYI